MTPPDDGTIRFSDREVTDWSRADRIEAGLSYIPEDRQEGGLVMAFDLVENALLGSQHSEPFSRGGRIDWDRVRDHAGAVVEDYDVRPPDPDTDAESLSGGNQQKFVVGRELERDPRLLVASHPTRGVDVGSIEFIHDRLLEMRSHGVAVLLVSSKLEEVTALSDRLAVVYEGEFVDVVDPDAVTEEELGLLMAGGHPDGRGAETAATGDSPRRDGGHVDRGDTDRDVDEDSSGGRQ